MAQKSTLIDDIDGAAIDEDGGTVRFSIDGASYEIDLSSKNTTELKEILSPFITAGRRARGTSAAASSAASARPKSDPQWLKAIREWAAENGHEVSSRGRISAEIQSAYEAAH